MNYKEFKPTHDLQDTIHAYWELKGDESGNRWERIFPDGCPGLIVNLGDRCITDNGAVSMEHGKTYVAGAMTTFKETLVSKDTHLVGVCLKPGAFSSFYAYHSLNELKDSTVQFDRSLSFEKDPFFRGNYVDYLDRFFTDKKNGKANRLNKVLDDIHVSKGLLTVDRLSRQNGISARQLERLFKDFVGLTPKEYANIIRFRHALHLIATPGHRALSDIAFECGYYDHSHLTNAVKRHTGFLPSEL